MEPSIDLLFQKYLANECSPDEVDRLFAWLAQSGSDGDLIRKELGQGLEGKGYSSPELERRLEIRLQGMLSLMGRQADSSVGDVGYPENAGNVGDGGSARNARNAGDGGSARNAWNAGSTGDRENIGSAGNMVGAGNVTGAWNMAGAGNAEDAGNVEDAGIMVGAGNVAGAGNMAGAGSIGEWENIGGGKNFGDTRNVDFSRRSRRIFFSPRKSVAAAIFLLVMAGGIYYYINARKYRSHVQEYAAPLYSRDILPPSMAHATLTLADGRQVSLDTAAAGSLAVQAGADLVKGSDGQLQYGLQCGRHYGRQDGDAESVLYNTLTVPRGSKVFSLVLSDGSRVWLNAASSLRYPVAFNGKDRTVELSGEAYFEVAGKADHPFLVKKGAMTVRVLGTKFNVCAYDDEDDIKITLLEGRVAAAVPDRTITLVPGQQAKVDKAGKLGIEKDVNMDEVMAWKNGRFELDGKGIGPIMRQVARWYDVEIAYEGAVPADNFMGGTSRQDNVSELLKMLEETGVVGFRIEGRKIIVMKK